MQFIGLGMIILFVCNLAGLVFQLSAFDFLLVSILLCIFPESVE